MILDTQPAKPLFLTPSLFSHHKTLISLTLTNVGYLGKQDSYDNQLRTKPKEWFLIIKECCKFQERWKLKVKIGENNVEMLGLIRWGYV